MDSLRHSLWLEAKRHYPYASFISVTRDEPGGSWLVRVYDTYSPDELELIVKYFV